MIPIEHSARFVKIFEMAKGNNMSCHSKAVSREKTLTTVNLHDANHHPTAGISIYQLCR